MNLLGMNPGLHAVSDNVRTSLEPPSFTITVQRGPYDPLLLPQINLLPSTQHLLLLLFAILLHPLLFAILFIHCSFATLHQLEHPLPLRYIDSFFLHPPFLPLTSSGSQQQSISTPATANHHIVHKIHTTYTNTLSGVSHIDLVNILSHQPNQVS